METLCLLFLPCLDRRSILMMAKVMMAGELTRLQDVYLHAVTRHVLLQREADAYIATVKAEAARDKNDGDATNNSPPPALSPEGARAVQEAAPSSAAPPAPVQKRARRRKGSQLRSAKGRRREGGLEDWRERLLTGAAQKAPPVSCVKMEGDLKTIRWVRRVGRGAGRADGRACVSAMVFEEIYGVLPRAGLV